MMYWILCVALFAGASSAQQHEVQKNVAPRNISVLLDHPSIVQIDVYRFWSTMDWVMECSGSVITTRFILTAATCTSGWSYEPRFRQIRAGSSVRQSGGLIFNVQDRINHPTWNTAYNGDLSLIRLVSALAYSPVIQQAAIAQPGSWLPTNLRLSQPGWGRNQQPVISRQEVITAPIASCGRRDGNFSSALNATANILCALPPAGVSNFDVGAPWIFNGVTVGIISGVNTVGVYQGLIGAEMSKHTGWVIDTVNWWQ